MQYIMNITNNNLLRKNISIIRRNNYEDYFNRQSIPDCYKREKLPRKNIAILHHKVGNTNKM